jgi:hypothetical protein
MSNDFIKGQMYAEIDGYEPSYLTHRDRNWPGQKFGRLNVVHLQPATETEYLNQKQ